MFLEYDDGFDQITSTFIRTPNNCAFFDCGMFIDGSLHLNGANGIAAEIITSSILPKYQK